VEIPSGLELIDTADWTARQVDRHSSGAVLAAGRLLAFGTAFGTGHNDANQGYGLTLYGLTPYGLTLYGPTLYGLTLYGLTLYGPGDRQPVHRFGANQVSWIQANGDLAYVQLMDANVSNLEGYAVAWKRWSPPRWMCQPGSGGGSAPGVEQARQQQQARDDQRAQGGDQHSGGAHVLDRAHPFAGLGMHQVQQPLHHGVDDLRRQHQHDRDHHQRDLGPVQPQPDRQTQRRHCHQQVDPGVALAREHQAKPTEGVAEAAQQAHGRDSSIPGEYQ
jgi:hypothetical protein